MIVVGGWEFVRPFRGETVCQALSGGDSRRGFCGIGGIFGDPRWLGRNGSRLRGARKGLGWSVYVPAFPLPRVFAMKIFFSLCWRTQFLKFGKKKLGTPFTHPFQMSAVLENGDGPPSRARQGRARAADGLSTRASLIASSRNCQPASPPGLQPHPLVRGARSPLLLAPQTARCACSRHKNVRGGTDALRSCAA